jgi:large subunit ribosomal protein L7A
MLDSIRNMKKIIGLKQSVKAIQNGQAEKVYIAKDAEERVVRSIREACDCRNIEIIYVESMNQLGKASGINVGASVVCILL